MVKENPMKTKGSTIPNDNPKRKAVFARPDGDQSLTHLGIVGDNYTILLTGQDTAGRYCLIDMLVPPGGGPPPHRHDFEEMFTLLEGELEFIFRGAKSALRTGETVNIPANAPHQFRNLAGRPARYACVRQRGRMSFLRPSASPSRIGQCRRQNLTQQPKPHSKQKPKSSLPNIGQSYCFHERIKITSWRNQTT
jgi:quercetin dioxygenase-like cupin family protein